MSRAAGPVPGSRDQLAPFEALPPLLAVVQSATSVGDSTEQLAGTSGKGALTVVGQTTHAGLISVIAAAFVTALVRAALAFQKYHFNNGLMLGATLAAVEWYEDTAASKALPPSRMIVLLIATSAGALSPVLQQSACVFSTGLAHAITPS